MDTQKQVKGEAKEYAYLAFISHNSKDAHIAKKLKRSLSSYRLPSTVSKQKGLAKKLPDIFRFQNTPLTLNDSIRRCTDRNGILDTYIPLPQQQDTYLIRSIDGKQNLLYGIDFDSEGINLELE